ncbi:MAG: hypothetical protein K1X44_00915 [Alphaproteobacteria bacterium]|nr:hypothetical protein [Alphaproteobacteria bacterium]
MKNISYYTSISIKLLCYFIISIIFINSGWAAPSMERIIYNSSTSEKDGFNIEERTFGDGSKLKLQTYTLDIKRFLFDDPTKPLLSPPRRLYTIGGTLPAGTLLNKTLSDVVNGDLLRAGGQGNPKPQSTSTNGQTGTLGKPTKSIAYYQNGDRIETYLDGTVFILYKDLGGYIIKDPKGNITFEFKGLPTAQGKYIVQALFNKITHTIAPKYMGSTGGSTVRVAPPSLFNLTSSVGTTARGLYSNAANNAMRDGSTVRVVPPSPFNQASSVGTTARGLYSNAADNAVRERPTVKETDINLDLNY